MIETLFIQAKTKAGFEAKLSAFEVNQTLLHLLRTLEKFGLREFTTQCLKL